MGQNFGQNIYFLVLSDKAHGDGFGDLSLTFLALDVEVEQDSTSEDEQNSHFQSCEIQWN